LFIALSCNSNKNSDTTTPDNSHAVIPPADELTEKIKADPNNADLYYQRSKWYLTEKKTGLAETDIRKALSIDSTKATYYMHLADVTFSKFDIPHAEEALNKTVALDPTNVNAFLRLGELYLYLKNYDLAMRNVNEALKLDKHRARAYMIKGLIFKENKDTVHAMSTFQTAVEQDPKYYDAYIQLGNMYAQQNNPAAIQYYNRALELRPNSVEVYYDRGLFFQNNRDLDKAAADYNALLKIDPKYANAYYNLGYIEMAYRNNYQKAIDYFSDALTRDQYYVEAYYNRGYCYEKLGDKTKARENYKIALDHSPTFQLAKEGIKRIGG
jgi:tetratricopeptide (TPR) repeat protein